MFVTIINDCRDSDEMGRQTTRCSVLFPKINISFMGVNNFSEIEAAGLLIDTLDASMGKEGIVLVNAAPRHGSGKKWKNGTPFGYFTIGKTLIISTMSGLTLSFIKKYSLLETMQMTDIPTVLDAMIEQGHFEKENRDRVVLTQFRSFEYAPLLAYWLSKGYDVPSEDYALSEFPDLPQAVWWVDNFGNSKTTILPEEIDFEPGKKMQTKIGELTCYNRLKDVPNDEAALIVGSSGYKNKRLLEIVVQGKSAAEKFGLKSGFELFG